MQRGYTLVEIVVALLLGGAIVVLAVAGYVFVTGDWQAQRQRLETQQNLRAAADLLSREVRLAGACLPDFASDPSSPLALHGANNGSQDTITVRSNVRCAKGTLEPPGASAGATSVVVDNVTEFVPNMQAYIIGPDGLGEPIFITGVNPNPSPNQTRGQLVLQAGLTRQGGYPQNSSSVYGVEAQTFAINASGPVPVLTVAGATGPAQPVVTGIEELNVRYVLDRACGPGFCVVDLPADTAEWAIVRTVQIDVVARSRRPVRAADPDGWYRLRQHLEIKPRNFLL
jgi:prepilin-type N-terminal cleavage/methylation domain-containing protein